MKRFLKFFLIAVFVILLLLGGLLAYLVYNLDEIKQYAVKQLNGYLKSELSVGEISINAWNTFPEISLQFKSVHMAEPLNRSKTLFEARYFYVGFNFYDVMKKNYVVKLMRIDSGSCHMFID